MVHGVGTIATEEKDIGTTINMCGVTIDAVMIGVVMIGMVDVMMIVVMMIVEMVIDEMMIAEMIAAGTMIGNDHHQRRAITTMIENNNDHLRKAAKTCYGRVLSFVEESVALKRTVPLWILGTVNEDSFIFPN